MPVLLNLNTLLDSSNPLQSNALQKCVCDPTSTPTIKVSLVTCLSLSFCVFFFYSIGVISELQECSNLLQCSSIQDIIIKNNKIYHGINKDTEIIECVVDRLYTRDRWGAFLLVFTGVADDGIIRCLRSGPRLFRPAFPFSWCIRYKQKDDYTFLQPSSLSYYLSTVQFYPHI